LQVQTVQVEVLYSFQDNDAQNGQLLVIVAMFIDKSYYLEKAEEEFYSKRV
jgi:hypothetical protein